MFSHPRILVSSLSVFDASFVKSGAVAVPRREFHALSFRLSGQITVETPESRLLSSAGELTFVPQGVSYRTEILENSRIYAVHFTTVDSYPKLAPTVITPPYPVALRNLFAGLHARYRVGLEHDLTCLSMFYEILAETARALPTPDDGGGRSPKLRAVKAQIDRRFDVSRDAEVSLEANPDSVTLPMLMRLRRAGFNRISIGVQSDDDAQLKALGRPHNYRQAQQAVSLSRRAGFDNISVDLMYGLPNQSREQWMQTLRNVIDLKADHISCYGLKVEPGTKLWTYKDCANLPDDDAQADMYFYAVETLEQFGYHQYEISNFAHDGFICRHNMKYWVGDEYLGFGPCAASDFAGRRFTIEPNLEKYIKGVMEKGVILSESELVPLRERAGEYLMLRLRTVDGIEKGEYTRSFLLPFEPIEEILIRLQAQEYAAFSAGRWHLTPKGFMLSNSILVELLEAQQKSRPLTQKK